MATDPKTADWPIVPELPLGYAAACLILAGLCAIPRLEDGPVLSGAFLVLAVVSGVIAIVTGVRARRTAAEHRG